MKRKIILSGVLIGLFVFLPALAFAQDYYVSTTGNDNNSGTQAAPWRTINKAVKTLQVGDTAYISPGTYNIAAGPGFEPSGYVRAYERNVPVVRLANAGTQSQPIRLIGLSTAASIIGGGPSSDDDVNQVFVTGGVISADSGKNYWEFQGLYIKSGGGLAANFVTGFTVRDSLIRVHPSWDLTENAAFQGGYPPKTYGSTNVVFDHIELWSLYMGEVHMVQEMQDIGGFNNSQNITVRNSFIYSSDNSISAYNNSSNFLFESNRNYFAGHFSGGAVPNFIIRNNVYAGWGNDGGFFKNPCGMTPKGYGVFHNNLDLLVMGPVFYTYPITCPESSFSNVILRNNLVIDDRSDEAVANSNAADVGVFDSDYNMLIFANQRPTNHFWGFYGGSGAWWNLSDWQTQTQFPQIRQDPNSQHLGPNVDPGFQTPISQLGQFEGMVDVASVCSVTLSGVSFGTEAHGYDKSNCVPPGYRIRLLDDLTLRSDSILIGAGDPAYGNGNIGPFAYTGEAPPENHPPVIAIISNQIARVNKNFSSNFSATDVDGDCVTFSALVKPAWLTLINNGCGSATLSGKPTKLDLGNNLVRIEATDGLETVTAEFTIKVVVRSMGIEAISEFIPEPTGGDNAPRGRKGMR